MQLFGGREPCGSGNGGGRPVIRVNMGDNGPHRPVPKPRDESRGGFGRDTSPLPGRPHHPGDLGDGSIAVRRHGGLNGPHKNRFATEADDPVAPGDGGIGRARDHAGVARTQRVGFGGSTADECVQTGIGQYDGHLLGVPDAQRQEIQPGGGDGLGPEVTRT